MRAPTTPFTTAVLLFLALAAFAVSALTVNGSAAAGEVVGRDASRLQDAATPRPGTRCSREKGKQCKRPGADNNAPVVSLRASELKITLACPEGQTSQTCTPSAGPKTQLRATASDPDGDTIIYTYSATGGRITGDGADVAWDLTGLQPGTYTATVEADDCCGCVAFSSVQVIVEACGDCAVTSR